MPFLDKQYCEIDGPVTFLLYELEYFFAFFWEHPVCFVLVIRWKYIYICINVLYIDTNIKHNISDKTLHQRGFFYWICVFDLHTQWSNSIQLLLNI